MYEHVYERKVDKQRRIALPPDWEFDEVLVLEGGGELKVIPKDGKKLAELIDSVPAQSLSFPYEKLKKEAYRRKYEGRK